MTLHPSPNLSWRLRSGGEHCHRELAAGNVAIGSWRSDSGGERCCWELVAEVRWRTLPSALGWGPVEDTAIGSWRRSLVGEHCHQDLTVEGRWGTSPLQTAGGKMVKMPSGAGSRGGGRGKTDRRGTNLFKTKLSSAKSRSNTTSGRDGFWFCGTKEARGVGTNEIPTQPNAMFYCTGQNCWVSSSAREGPRNLKQVVSGIHFAYL